MSNLKAHWIPTRSGNFLHCYFKDEADKVIADLKTERDEYRYNLSCARNEIHNMQAPMREDIKTIAELKADYKEACDRLQTANLIKDEQLAATRHQKYKRCLAMARIAQDDWHLHNSFYAMGHQEFEKRKCEFYEKWRKIWLALAEQFKEAK